MLLDDFELTSTPVGADLQGDEEWIPAIVPGGVHESLIASGGLRHPYSDRHELDARWIEERDWWYRTTFCPPQAASPAQRTVLTFHGLDTVADIWLNGTRLARHTSMFTPLELDVTDALRPGGGELLLRFSPPLAGIDVPDSTRESITRVQAALGRADSPDREDGSGVMHDATARATLRRKAMFSWGWDFGPRLPSIGLWRPVSLTAWQRARVVGHHVRTLSLDADHSVARIGVHVEVEADTENDTADLAAVFVVTTPDGREIEARAALPRTDGPPRQAWVELEVHDPQLWWTCDLGDQPLHTLRVDLESDDAVLDSRGDRFGVRTISLDQSPDEAGGGRLFRLLVNGVPIFARGAAWLPADMMVGSVRPERYRGLVRAARAGNMNMLRVWGGGVYEHDAFYDACDEAGILVWQDFMFACLDYPSDDPTLLEEVRLEAVHQVRRLRNHASLALWAGNNEIQALHELGFGDLAPGNWGWPIFHELLPSVVATHSDGIYWPSSPYGTHDPRGANGVMEGDRHAWEVWHGHDVGAGEHESYGSAGEAMHFRRYRHDTGKFISEFGICSAPALPTLRSWIPDADLRLDSESFEHRIKDRPKDKGLALLAVETGQPRGLTEYVQFTMAVQAEGLKYGIEHYRRRQPSTSGTLIWQLNDVWPGVSWSVIDWAGTAKAGYHAVRRAYAPVLASFKTTDDGRLELWVSNSGRAPVETVAVIEFLSLRGGVIDAAEVAVRLAAASSERVWSGPLPSDVTRVVPWVSSPTGAFPANRCFLAPLKELDLPAARVTSTLVSRDGASATVDVRADGFAYFVHLPDLAGPMVATDDYFDLRPGTSRRVTVSGLSAADDVTALIRAVPFVSTPPPPSRGRP